MRKMVRNLGIITILLIGAIIITQCKKDDSGDSITYGTLSGSVSLNNGTVADGAVVSLSTEANAANVISRVVTDETGTYSIIGLEPGTYYLNAAWEPSNNNNLLKSAKTVILTGAESEVAMDGNLTANIVLSGMVSSGSGSVDIADGWIYDDTHSMIAFEFPYDAENAVFSGHFARAGFDELSFDEAHPENTKIRAWVDVVSIETGSPSLPCGHGRDGITGCISGTFKVQKDPNDTITNFCQDGKVVTNWPNDTTLVAQADIWGGSPVSNYKRQSAIVGKTGVATFVSTEVTSYGTGYLAKGNFTFAGVTKSVNMYFSYLEGFTNGDNTKTFASFYGWFKFAALTDFAISSSHVGNSNVTVKLSIQVNKNL